MPCNMLACIVMTSAFGLLQCTWRTNSGHADFSSLRLESVRISASPDRFSLMRRARSQRMPAGTSAVTFDLGVVWLKKAAAAWPPGNRKCWLNLGRLISSQEQEQRILVEIRLIEVATANISEQAGACPAACDITNCARPFKTS